MILLHERVYWELINALDEYVLNNIHNPEFKSCNLFPKSDTYEQFMNIYRGGNEIRALTYLIWTKYERVPNETILVLKKRGTTKYRGVPSRRRPWNDIYEFFKHPK